MSRPLTRDELKQIKEGQSRETIAKIRFWRLRLDGIAFRPPTETKAGIFCILEFKRMSDVTDQYLIRTRSWADNQYESLRRALGVTLQRQGWQVEQISFIAGSRSLDEQNLRQNLKFFQVPETSIESIGSKLAMRIFDEYANILKCMYSTRFNGGSIAELCLLLEQFFLPSKSLVIRKYLELYFRCKDTPMNSRTLRK